MLQFTCALLTGFGAASFHSPIFALVITLVPPEAKQITRSEFTSISSVRSSFKPQLSLICSSHDHVNSIITIHCQIYQIQEAGCMARSASDSRKCHYYCMPDAPPNHWRVRTGFQPPANGPALPWQAPPPFPPAMPCFTHLPWGYADPPGQKPNILRDPGPERPHAVPPRPPPRYQHPLRR